MRPVQTHVSAHRNTARKFVAASNFLELLRLFDSEKVATDLPSIEEKIKYAKWKAADIAKALREGRKPIPGPPGSAAPESPPAPTLPDLNVVPPPTTPPSTSTGLPPKESPPSITRSTPPPPNLTRFTSLEGADLGAPLPDGLAPPQPPQSPGSWSTAATPGTPGFVLDHSTSPTSASSQSPLGSGGRSRTAFVSEELEGKTDEDMDADTTPPTSAAKSVHFSPSVVGGLVTPSALGLGGPEQDPFSVSVVGTFGMPAQPSAPPLDPSSTYPFAPAPQMSGYPNTRHIQPPSMGPTPSSPYAHVHSVPPASSPGVGAATSTVTTRPAELTPQIIARAQKHCRFAISALDYEDAEQAVKELRAALRMLGG